jgi:hypothetical protein
MKRKFSALINASAVALGLSVLGSGFYEANAAS